MNKKCFILSIIIASSLTACASHQQNAGDVDTANLSQLQGVKVTPITASNSQSDLSQLRVKSLEDTAMSIGAQGGLAWASDQLNTKLNNDRKYLDSIFNFYGMVLEHGVIPPVLVQGDNSLNLNDPDTIRVADRTYQIVAQARFATTPPNWREYLLMSFPKPALPDKSLLPKSDAEQKAWSNGVNKGWQKGIQQAYDIFQQNLARLKRDFNGMALYRKLLTQKMISPPYVARTELGITGDGNDMRVNDQVLRIVEHPQLQTSGNHWQAVVVKRHE